MNSTSTQIPEYLRMFDTEYIPENIIPREEISKSVLKLIWSTIQTNTDQNILLQGHKGAGKYTFSLDVNNQLEKHLKNSGKTLYTIIIDFNKHLSRNQIFSDVLRQVAPENPVIKGKKRPHYPDFILSDFISSKDAVFFIILKDVDQMEDDYILRYFACFRELMGEKIFGLRNRSIVTLATVQSFFFVSDLEPAIESRYHPLRFTIPFFSWKGMYNILKERTEALSDITLDDKVIVKCAKKGEEFGDADMAVELLRSSIIRAESSHSNHVRLEHYYKAIYDYELDITIDYLDNLSKNQKLIFHSILEALEKKTHLSKSEAEKKTHLSKSEASKEKMHITTDKVKHDYVEICKKYQINPISRMETFAANITSLGTLIQTQLVHRGRKGNTRQISIPTRAKGIEQYFWTDAMRTLCNRLKST